MVSDEFKFPLEAALFFKDTSMLILYKNVRFVLFTKISTDTILANALSNLL